MLPSLREKHDGFLLRELVKRWVNHKVMVRWLSRFFFYLDRYFIARRSLPPLNDVGLLCFRKLVYGEINIRSREAVISMTKDFTRMYHLFFRKAWTQFPLCLNSMLLLRV